MTHSLIAEPFTARLCPECGAWIYVAAGPFAEGDPTKTKADGDHYIRHQQPTLHPSPIEGEHVIGYPYFDWNTKPVVAIWEHAGS